MGQRSSGKGSITVHAFFDEAQAPYPFGADDR